MWALGCIIHELCTLNFCFNDNSINELIKKITSSNHEKIDQNKYSKDLQNIIDLLLEIDYNKRPNVEEIIKMVENYINKYFSKSMQSELENDEIYQNYRLEKSILIAIDQIHINILKRENRYNEFKTIFIYSLMAYPTAIAIGILISGGLGFFISCAVNIVYLQFSKYLIGKQEKEDFIKSNYLIFSHIENNLIEIINKKLDKKLLKEQIIYIYNEEKLKIQITKIKNKLLSQKYIQKLKKIITKNFNVLLVGNTNVGKSTLINEFLKLEEDKKAKESDGGPTNTIDFTSYKGQNSNNIYTLYDTNGITYDGKNCIENKIANTIKEIDLRISSENPNKLIHCIFYCVTGSNIQPSDGKFIKELLNIYTT